MHSDGPLLLLLALELPLRDPRLCLLCCCHPRYAGFQPLSFVASDKYILSADKYILSDGYNSSAILYDIYNENLDYIVGYNFDNLSKLPA